MSASPNHSTLKDAAAIVGIGQSKFARGLPESEEFLAASVIADALADAGICASEVDGLCSYTMETTEEEEVARDLGMGNIRFFSQITAGGGAGCATIGHAAMAIATGQADVVVAWRSRKRGDRSSAPWMNTQARVRGRESWTRAWGVVRPVDEIALLATRYMHEYGATRDHLANVALAIRKYANANPAAIMGGRTMTRDEYMAARWVCDPLCLFDCCLESDGALAAVLVSAERAKDRAQPPAYVHAFGQGIGPGGITMSNYWNDDPLRGPSWTAGDTLWRHSDFTPADVDVAQIYDAFTPLVLLSLEGYGFCGRGEAPGFSEGGAFDIGGRLPLNTSGGSLSEAYIHGFNLITEGVKQLRGTSTSQVPDAETCFVSSGEGVPTSAILLRR